MSNPELCVCGHWDSRHHEIHDEETGEAFFACHYLSCDCLDFEPDPQATRDAENEAKERAYNERTEK